MFSRDEVRAITDKLIDMATADAVDVDLSAGERSATRFANSTITANMVQFDQQVTLTLYKGSRLGSASTRQFDDASLKQTVEEATSAIERARETPNIPSLTEGPQDYIPVDAALPNAVNFGPAERARIVKQSIEVAEKMGVRGSGYVPKVYQTTCNANSKGLFAYYQYAEAGFVLTCRTLDAGGSGWAGITGVKNVSRIDAEHLTEVAANKALRSRKPRALEPGRYTVILEPRPTARFLSLMMGLFNARSAENPLARTYFTGKEPGSTRIGEKLFSSAITIKSDVGNPILRQSPIGVDGLAARPIDWVENGVLKNLSYDREWAARQKKSITPTSPTSSLVLEGTNATDEDIIKSTRRGLLCSFLWYIRTVDQETLLNTGMTRDGLFLIENGEIVGPVQNFRWNMSPIAGFNNVTAVGKAVPIHTGESYDGAGTALVPTVRIEDFLMTSVSPAV